MRVVLLVVAAVATMALDQASKFVVVRRVGRVRRGRVALVLVDNARGAWVGVAPRAATVVLAVVAGGMLLALALSDRAGALASCGLGLSLGGAASNLADRWRRGAVVDFVAVGRWPVFNLADVALVAGVALTAWGLA